MMNIHIIFISIINIIYENVINIVEYYVIMYDMINVEY